MIWPLSIIMRGLTSNNDTEVKQCLADVDNIPMQAQASCMNLLIKMMRQNLPVNGLPGQIHFLENL